MKNLKDLGISTPPWSVGDGIHADSCHEIRSERKVLATLNWKSPECEADANLISAAPELYDALHRVEEELCTQCEFFDDCHLCRAKPDECELLLLVRQALYKASGAPDEGAD